MTPTAFGTSPKFDIKVAVYIKILVSNLGEAGRGSKADYEELCY